MNILLVRPRPDSRSVNVQRFILPEPLELEIVATHLRDLGHDVDLVDLVLERRPLHRFVTQRQYDLVAFTAYVNQVEVVKQLARDVKRVSPHTQVVVGGIHAEAQPTDFIDPAIDHILWANSVSTIGVIAAGASAAETACLPGVWGSGKARPVPVHPQGLLPDRTITAKYRPRYHYVHHERSASLKTAYGCPVPCATGCRHDCTYTERDLDEVMGELATIDEPHVLIVDDDFLSRPSGIAAFCRALDAHRISKRFVAYGRADYVVDHPDDVSILAAHGFEGLFLALDPSTALELSDPDPTSADRVSAALQSLEGAGVQLYSDLFTGKDWDRADFDRLIGFLNQLEYPMVSVRPETPMPGSLHLHDEPHRVSQWREHPERWDNAHLAFRPTQLQARAYYWNLLRADYLTSANPSCRRYIKDRYGNRVLRRMLRGALGNSWQFLKLIVHPD